LYKVTPEAARYAMENVIITAAGYCRPYILPGAQPTHQITVSATQMNTVCTLGLQTIYFMVICVETTGSLK